MTTTGDSFFPSPSPDNVVPIAVVGVSGRFPGDAENPQKLWDMISEGRSALSDIPSDRFNVDAFYHPHNERQGTINVRKAHFMKRDVSAFDAPFFTLPIAEAEAMDPQQRMALECTYEALENAGIRMEDVSGSNTSCYIGCFTRDYSDMLACDPEDLPLYHGTGTGSAIMSNRISWFYNLKGPSISLDTACSSSMVALHLACQSLRSGESSMSIVGGTNLILLPDIMGAMTRLHFLSPDGKCQSFDSRGNGYSRGEGAAFCVLKPLHLALKDGDVIRGVIRNTAVNQDGNTPGITVPSTDAQEALIRRVYAEAGLTLANTAYVEAHGTGTPAGDPVEASALGKTFGQARAYAGPLIIGSVKSNIGHLEGGSGMVQLIKTILMLEKGEIPPSIWYEKPNPRIPMQEWNLSVPTELTPWPSVGLRRVSINSFGYGGTNAHCIVDDAYHYLKARRLQGRHNVEGVDSLSRASSLDSGVDMLSQCPTPGILSAGKEQDLAMRFQTRPRLILWTSNEQSGIDRNAQSLASYLERKLADATTDKEAETTFDRFSKTLATRRSIFPWRSFVVANSMADAAGKLRTLSTKAVRTSQSKSSPSLAWVFTGQGAQWSGMGRELYNHPVSRRSLETAEGALVGIGCRWSLAKELFRDPETSRLDAPGFSQPICTAIQLALVDLLRSWGVRPHAVVGHSSGEIAAAYAKGAIDGDTALKIAYYRGQLFELQGATLPMGAMLATGLGVEAVESYIARLARPGAVVACVTSPSSTTVAGDVDAVSELEQLLHEEQHFARRLRVGVAYHTPHMAAVAEVYRQLLGNVPTLPEEEGAATMFSSVTSGRVESNTEMDTAYWVANLISPVNFSEALSALLTFSSPNAKRRTRKSSVQHIIEIGPHSALKGPIKQIIATIPAAADVTYQSLLERGQDAHETALAVAGRMFQYGYPILADTLDEDGTSSPFANFLVDLPPFAWNHSLKYWSESHWGKAHRFRKHTRTDLLGYERSEEIPNEPRYRNILRVEEIPWTRFHRVQGSILYPAAGMLIMAIEAMRQKADETCEIVGYELRDVVIGNAIVVPEDNSGVETMLSLRPFRHSTRSLAAAWQEFSLHSRKEAWTLNCTGLIRIEYAGKTNPVFTDEDKFKAADYHSEYARVKDGCFRSVHYRHFYDSLGGIGLQYESVFQGLTEIRKGAYQSAARLTIPDTRSTMPKHYEMPHVIHPATLDSIIQLALPATCAADEELQTALVPVGIGRLYVSSAMPSTPGVSLPGYATTRVTGFEEGESTVVLGNNDWSQPLVIFEGIRGKKIDTAAVGAGNTSQSLRKIGTYFHWQEDITLLEKSQVLQLCGQATNDQVRKNARQILMEAEMASIIIIKRVLQACSPEESLCFAWNFKLYYDYMRRCYERGLAGTLVYQNDTACLDWLNLGADAEEELLARVATASSDGRVLVEHGKYLPQILRGEIPPLQILMADNFLHDFYHGGDGTAQHYAQMCWYVKQMAHKNPNMNVLEIGGGTAAATLPILTELGGSNGTAPRFSHYTFTDISPGYFEKARTKLNAWVPLMTFAKLDIEIDPCDQGFAEAQYDLIVASNVLHATKSIVNTLQHARKLLKPTGKLVLTEVTPGQKMRYHMIVGSLEGWWYGEEDGRHLGPTLEVDQWNAALVDAGYSGVDVHFRDFVDPKDTGLSVIVAGVASLPVFATAQEVTVILPMSPEPDVKSTAHRLQQRLAADRCCSSIVSLHDIEDLDLTNQSCISLVDANDNAGFLSHVEEAEWSLLKKAILTSREITYVTRGGTGDSVNPFSNLMTGLARSIRSENHDTSLTTLDAECGVALDSDANIAAMMKIFYASTKLKEVERPDYEYAIREGRPMVQRVLLEKGTNDMIAAVHAAPKPQPGCLHQPTRPLALKIGTPGRLDTLYFDDDQHSSKALGPDEVEIDVKAVGLNFKDVMVAMGQLSQPELGVECAGVVLRKGHEVAGFEPGTAVMTWKLGTFNTTTRAPAAMLQPIPNGLDFHIAASLPVVHTTVYHSIVTVARLKPGETILIHGGAGGVGQAAIMLAQHVGAVIIATVSSEEKKALLEKNYGIPGTHILNSRDANAFQKGVLRLTNGRGVHVVLNSLAGEALRASWNCIARFGRFVELGLKDIVSNTGMDMAPFERNASFHAVNMLDLLDYDQPAASHAFAKAMELVRLGVLKPVAPINTMPVSRIEEAFRLMQTGKHTGKVVVDMTDDADVPVVHAKPKSVSFKGDATYVIAGGGGGLGRSIAEWMVGRGAKNILLLSRSGDQKPTVKKLIERLTKEGARIEAWPCDISDKHQILAAVDRCASTGWPLVRGVIQGAMDICDTIYQNMTCADFNKAILPKVQGSWNLHEVLPQDMDFFVLLSSSVGIAGSRGQGNYSAGNAFQDALAFYRQNRGLRACCIDLGLILGSGFLAEDTTDSLVHDNIKTWNFLGIHERELMTIIEAAIRGETLPGMKMLAQLITGLGTGGMLAQNKSKYPWWFKDTKFAHITQVDTHRSIQQGADLETPLAVLLPQATSVEQAGQLICEALVQKLARSLLVSVDDIEPSGPVSSYGVDSLLAVELRTWIHTEIKADVSVFDLLSNTPIHELAAKIASSSSLDDAGNMVGE